jgi:DNA-binding transcriptional regulator LsrR (DeoR family)
MNQPRRRKDFSPVVLAPLRPSLEAKDLVAIQVCRLFYDDQLTKIEIANRLGISRFRVARLIEQARESGLIQIEYGDREFLHPDLAQALSQRFGLRLCQVVRAPASRDPADVAMSVGHVAAALVSDLLARGDIVGLGWGRAVGAVVDQLPSRSDLDIDVVQLAGGSARAAFGIDPSELAHGAAARLGGVLHALHAPAFVETREIRDALLRELEIVETVQLFDSVTLAVLGIGAPSPMGEDSPRSALSIEGVLSPIALEQLLEAGAVGDFILHAFDDEGRFVGAELEDRSVAISVEQLQRVPRVLAVAYGANKGRALAAALRTGVPTMLVTDEAAASLALAVRLERR